MGRPLCATHAAGHSEGWDGRESTSDWLTREADLPKPNPQTTVGERGLWIYEGGILEASRRRYLQAWLDSSLLHSHDHHRRKGKPWLTKLWCPKGTALEAVKGEAAAQPAALPMTPLWLSQPCQPGLAQPAPNHRVSSAQLMTVLPAAQATTLLRGRQQLTTEPAGPDSDRAKNHSHLSHHILWP